MKIAVFGATNPKATRKIEQILQALPSISVLSSPASPDDADMAISVGGDGTFLRTAAAIGDKGIPILGVNAGHLGFLTDISLEESDTALPRILIDRKYTVEERALIQMEIPGRKEHYNRFALNEVAVLKRDQSSMVSVTLKVDGEVLNTYDADGLCIATPTGSTAYAMSAGGPILEPHSNCFEIVAIAPHSLTTRPLVIRDSAILNITVESRNGLYLVAVDGVAIPLTTGDELVLSRAPFHTRVVRRKGHTFFDTLKAKLMWGQGGIAH